ncbi:multidrug efflux pump subunit AcrA (membrane-fusion protein) [Bradyrhizobium sp. LM6.10]
MKKSRPILWILIIAAVASAGYYGWHKFGSPDAAKTQTAQKGPQRPPAVLVSVSPVQKVDFPVYLTGLGTVAGFNTVQVRTRVDGQIDKIAFTEGQIVKQDELLVSIDPRPYQATLDQAKAKRAQDEANLANANLELQRAMKLGEFATAQRVDTQRSTVAQLTAQIAADDAAISNAQNPSSTTPRSRHRSPASRACARSTWATSSTPRRRPASSRYRRSSRSR